MDRLGCCYGCLKEKNYVAKIACGVIVSIKIFWCVGGKRSAYVVLDTFSPEEEKKKTSCIRRGVAGD